MEAQYPAFHSCRDDLLYVIDLESIYLRRKQCNARVGIRKTGI